MLKTSAPGLHLHIMEEVWSEPLAMSLGYIACFAPGIPASAFSLLISMPKRHARLDLGAQFSKLSDSEIFRKLSPSPARTTCFCLLCKL